MSTLILSFERKFVIVQESKLYLYQYFYTLIFRLGLCFLFIWGAASYSRRQVVAFNAPALVRDNISRRDHFFATHIVSLKVAWLAIFLCWPRLSSSSTPLDRLATSGLWASSRYRLSFSVFAY